MTPPPCRHHMPPPPSPSLPPPYTLEKGPLVAPFAQFFLFLTQAVNFWGLLARKALLHSYFYALRLPAVLNVLCPFSVPSVSILKLHLFLTTKNFVLVTSMLHLHRGIVFRLPIHT
eukprot:1150600-Pelagomonas_calceolata.AAC.3